MSDQSNPLFPPFVPPVTTGETLAFTTIPFTPAPATPPAKQTRKPKPIPKTVADEIKAAVRKTKRKPKPPKQPIAPEETPRPRSLDLQTILRATSGLKDEDFAMFDALFNMTKPQRERILVAIEKVFA